MTTQRAEDLVRQLVPLESFISPLVPTRRFGIPALVGTASPIRRSRPTDAPPTFWFVTDPQRVELLAFARTDLFSPISWPPPTRPGESPETGTPLHPRDAYLKLRELGDGAAQRFFADESIDRATGEDIVRSYATAIPAGQLGWIQECCRDYFNWLQQASS